MLWNTVNSILAFFIDNLHHPNIRTIGAYLLVFNAAPLNQKLNNLLILLQITFFTMTTLNTNLLTFRRVKERQVGEAWEKVQYWRRLFNEGHPDEQGVYQKLTLGGAAEIIGIPKKTLEDYSQIFKKLEQISDVARFWEKKMGYLRNYLRKNAHKLEIPISTRKFKKSKKSKPEIHTMDEESDNTEKYDLEQYHYSEYEEQEFSYNVFAVQYKPKIDDEFDCEEEEQII